MMFPLDFIYQDEERKGTMTRKQIRATVAELKELLSRDKEFLRPLVEEVLQQVLEAEM